MKKRIEQVKSFCNGMLKAEMVMGIIVISVISLIACKMPEIIEDGKTEVKNKNMERESKENGLTVIIDPGHGGVDPGKIGINNVPEKEINLAIGLKLKEQLEDSGYHVIMTRSSDVGLYTDSDSNKKRADMNSRCGLINTEYTKDSRVINVSIHQNSYPAESVKGPQVFYYSKSENGKTLAKILQSVINEQMEVERPRTEKANDNYYMLVHTDCPSVIVECGFLSNREEAEKLSSDDYQRKMVEAIVKGIEEYHKEKNL